MCFIRLRVLQHSFHMGAVFLFIQTSVDGWTDELNYNFENMRILELRNHVHLDINSYLSSWGEMGLYHER